MKNRFIELERFIASCLVLLYHVGLSKGSWIFVEFFFLLTGYFTMSHLERKKSMLLENEDWYPIKYTFNKFVKLFPYTGISIVAIWIIRAIEFDLSMGDLVKWVLCIPSELLLLGGTGMLPIGLKISDSFATSRLLNPHLWYICSMLFVLPIIVYLLTKRKNKTILLTTIPLLLYGILIMKDGTVDGWHDKSFGIVYCNMRAFAGILLGACSYYFTQWWKAKEYTILGKGILTVIEVFSFIAVVVISYTTRLRFDVLQIGLLFLSVSLTNAGVTYTSKIINRKLEFLGSISLPIYCLQMPVILVCSRFLNISNGIIIFLITLILSVLNELVFKYVSIWYKKYEIQIKKLVIKL